VHSLRVEAPGYLTRTEVLSLDHDRLIDVTLAAVPQGSEDRAAVVPDGGSTPDAPADAGSLGPKPSSKNGRKHQLDTRNPYDDQ
jgi:hypothetical protein